VNDVNKHLPRGKWIYWEADEDLERNADIYEMITRISCDTHDREPVVTEALLFILEKLKK
jgi:hypothetical protein